MERDTQPTFPRKPLESLAGLTGDDEPGAEGRRGGREDRGDNEPPGGSVVFSLTQASTRCAVTQDRQGQPLLLARFLPFFFFFITIIIYFYSIAKHDIGSRGSTIAEEVREA